MGEYISREWLRKWAEEVCEWWGEEAEVQGSLVLRMPEEAPAADVVEVVRCKDCKYSAAICEYGCYCRKVDAPWFNDTFEVYMDLDDFCSYGERKEDA